MLIPGVERGYWPRDPVAVPIIEPGAGRRGKEPLREGRIVERVPSSVTEPLDIRPDYFISAEKEIGRTLGLEPDDLVAVRASCEASDGEIVIARMAGTQPICCGELRRGEVRGSATTAVIAADKSEGGCRIEGVVIGYVMFRSLDQLRSESGRSNAGPRR